MREKSLILYGVGRFAEYAEYVFNMDSNYSVKAFTMEDSFLKTLNKSNGCSTVQPFSTIEEKYKPEEHDLFIAIGNNLIRERIFSLAKRKGYKLATYISSKASFWENLKVGENSFIGEGSILQPFTTIGNNSILFSTRTGHHSQIGDHTLLSACLLGGNVKIGDYSFLGLHSSIKENTAIGVRNIIGMGSIINQNTGPGEIYSAPLAKKRNLTFEEFYRNHS